MHFSAGQDVTLKNYGARTFLHWRSLTLIRPGGTLCPYLNHCISSKRLGVWSYCFVTFLSMYFPFRKVQFHQSALMYVAMATMQLFGLFWKTWIAIAFPVFPPERNFLWDNLLCLGHHNTLRSLIIAIIRTVTLETFQKSFCPNMVIDTKLSDYCIFHSL